MSWLFAHFGKNSERIIQSIKKLGINPSQELKTNNSYLAFGGIRETLSFNENSNIKWIACGVGLVKESSAVKLAAKNDWQSFFNSDGSKDIWGHYACLKWNGKNAVVYTDKTGLRDIYFVRTDESITISTRADLLAKQLKLDLDFKEFSTRWILFNQISHKSIFANCKRLVAGRGIKVDLNTFDITEFNNTFDYPSVSTDNLILQNSLTAYLKLPVNSNKTLSLSLSGGLDSRVILALLNNLDIGEWDAHTFGHPQHPDSIIAEEISSKLNIVHNSIDLKLPAISETISEIKNYTGLTLVNNPASAIRQLRNYNGLVNLGKIIVDGGFGEIWRREFLFKLQLKGSKAILNKNSEEIVKYMKHFRADIFNDETNLIVEQNAVEQVKNMIHKIPDPVDIGLGNWLDYFAIKTRLPNYYGHEQARLDEYLIAIMPFAQYDTLEPVFSYPISQRRNGKYFRQIIQNNHKELASFPLVKGTVINPFGLTSFQSRLYSVIQKKFNRNLYKDSGANDLLFNLKEYIFDIINSTDFLNYSYYNHEKIKNTVTEYYNGNTRFVNELDWFLSFELFRQHIYDD